MFKWSVWGIRPHVRLASAICLLRFASVHFSGRHCKIPLCFCMRGAYRQVSRTSTRTKEKREHHFQTKFFIQDRRVGLFLCFVFPLAFAMWPFLATRCACILITFEIINERLSINCLNRNLPARASFALTLNLILLFFRFPLISSFAFGIVSAVEKPPRSLHLFLRHSDCSARSLFGDDAGQTANDGSERAPKDVSSWMNPMPKRSHIHFQGLWYT